MNKMKGYIYIQKEIMLCEVNENNNNAHKFRDVEMKERYKMYIQYKKASSTWRCSNFN